MGEGQSLDRPFDPFRTAKGENLRDLVLLACREVERHEDRQRRRRPEAQTRFEETVEAVISDTVQRSLTDPAGWVSVPLSKQILGYADRYGARTLSKQLPGVLSALNALGFLHLEKGYSEFSGDRRRTTIKGTDRLLAMVDAAGITLRDIGRDATAEEVIVLKRSKLGFWDDGDRIDYADTPETHRFRQEVRTINGHLAGSRIEFDQQGSGLSFRVDVEQRTLRRYFNNGSFDQGGRLFGGFWQSLPKGVRKGCLRIGGEGVAEVDFGQFNVRASYALAGAVPPQGDQYSVPGLEDHREGIKKVFNALLSTTKLLRKLPRETRPLLPQGIAVGDVVGALGRKHPPLVPLFCRGLIGALQRMESTILVRVLLTLLRDGIVALPIHDAVVVPVSQAAKVQAVMAHTFTEETGVSAAVSIG